MFYYGFCTGASVMAVISIIVYELWLANVRRDARYWELKAHEYATELLEDMSRRAK